MRIFFVGLSFFIALPCSAVISKQVFCSVPLALIGSNPGLFTDYYVDHAEAARLASESANAILSPKQGIENLSPSNRYVSRSSNEVFPSYSKRAVARRLLAVSKFFEKEAKKKQEFDLDPSDPHYWDLMNGFAIRVPEDQVVGAILGMWLDQLGRLQTVENAFDYNRVPVPFLKVLRSSVAFIGLAVLANILIVGPTEVTYRDWAALVLYLAVNDNLFRDWFIHRDPKAPQRVFDILTDGNRNRTGWLYHGVSATIPLGAALKNARVLELAQEDDDEKALSEKDDGYGGIILAPHTLYPSFEPIPNFVSPAIFEVINQRAFLRSLPTIVQGLGTLIQKFTKRNPRAEIGVQDKVEVDLFVEQHGEEGKSKRVLTLWIRRTPT